jgi:hypothetical protein
MSVVPTQGCPYAARCQAVMGARVGSAYTRAGVILCELPRFLSLGGNYYNICQFVDKTDGNSYSREGSMERPSIQSAFQSDVSPG